MRGGDLKLTSPRRVVAAVCRRRDREENVGASPNAIRALPAERFSGRARRATMPSIRSNRP